MQETKILHSNVSSVKERLQTPPPGNHPHQVDEGSNGPSHSDKDPTSSNTCRCVPRRCNPPSLLHPGLQIQLACRRIPQEFGVPLQITSNLILDIESQLGVPPGILAQSVAQGLIVQQAHESHSQGFRVFRANKDACGLLHTMVFPITPLR